MIRLFFNRKMSLFFKKKAISKEEIIVSTGNDRELQKLIKCVEEKCIDHKDADMGKYSNVFNELV